MTLEQKDVARLEHDVADPAAEALTVACRRDHHRLELGPELALANRQATERIAARHDGFDETTLVGRAMQFERLVGREREPGNPLEVDDGLPRADEHQTVAPLELRRGL